MPNWTDDGLGDAHDRNQFYYNKEKGKNMPNWDGDEGPSYGEYEEDWDRHTPRTRTNTPQRHSIFNTPERKVHKTWNGKPVQHMDSDHIMNSLMFCERKFSEAKRAFADCFDDSTFYFETVFDMFPEYQHLRDEWFKRLKG